MNHTQAGVPLSMFSHVKTTVHIAGMDGESVMSAGGFGVPQFIPKSALVPPVKTNDCVKLKQPDLPQHAHTAGSWTKQNRGVSSTNSQSNEDAHHVLLKWKDKEYCDLVPNPPQLPELPFYALQGKHPVDPIYPFVETGKYFSDIFDDLIDSFGPSAASHAYSKPRKQFPPGNASKSTKYRKDK